MGLLEKISSSSFFELLCILQLGFGTNFMFTGYDTHSFILESVLHSVNERHPEQIDEYAGYYGQSVDYIFFTIACFFTPMLVRYAGPKWSLFLGSICFTVYQCGFFYLNTYYFYCASALMGIGYAMFYAGQGCYLTEHSSPNYMARNSSLAWSLATSSMSVGGIVLLIVFHRNTSYSNDGRYREFSDKEIHIIFGTFSAISLLSNVTFFLMPSKKVENSVSDANGWQEDNRSFRESFFATFKAFKNLNIWLLSSSWFYLGIVTTFWLGPCPTALIFTQRLSKSKILIPLFSLAIGFGELTTAAFVTYLSRKYHDFGRIPAVVVAAITNLIAFTLVLLSTPQYATLRPTTNDTLLIQPNVYVAVLCAYLLGIADCFWNTARNCFISSFLPDSRAEGFAISKIFQSLSSCAIYFLSSIIDVYTHLGILVAFLILCIVTLFMAVRRQGRIHSKEKLISITGVTELTKEDQGL